MELAEAKAAHARLVGIFARFNADNNKTQAGPDCSRIRPGKVEQEAQRAGASLDWARKQSVESAKAAKGAFRQLTKMLCRAQLLE